MLVPTLGPVLGVTATGRLTGTTTLDLVHAGGAVSRVELDIVAVLADAERRLAGLGDV